jgi:hypothetical protein
MSADISVVIISGALSLFGVLIGTGAAVFGQRSSTRESRIQSEIERRQALRAEIKDAISAYLEVTQHLQTQLYTRKHFRKAIDVTAAVEQIWLAHAQVDIVCSEILREPLVRHATVLNEVARHGERYPDWWAVVLPYKDSLLNAIREELRQSNDTSNRTQHDSAESTYLDDYLSWLSEFESAAEPSDPHETDRHRIRRTRRRRPLRL